MLAPGRIYPGTSLRLEAKFADDDGNALDPETVTFWTFSPSCTETLYVYGTDDEVQQEAAGSYYADILIPTDGAGAWEYGWDTGGEGTVSVNSSVFNVQYLRRFGHVARDY